MSTCTGHLDLYRPGIADTARVGGNARQRRRKIRLLKAQGWTVHSWLRVELDSASTVIVTNPR